MPTLRKAAGLMAVPLLACVVLAGCSSSSKDSAAASSAQARASSIAAQPTVSADIAQLESELLTSYQQNFSAAHPVTSMEKALHTVFPSASLSTSATFAVDHLTTTMAHHTAAGKAARMAWAQIVVEHILTENPNATASPGSAVIPAAPASPTASP